MTVEFDCADCRRHIVALGVAAPPADGLCAHCQWWPGWCDDPRLRRILDAENDARPPRPREAWPAAVRTWSAGWSRAAVEAYVDERCVERACDRCGTPYRGPAVYCSLDCALADA